MKNKITKTFIAQFLPSDPIIVEAGAHKGKDTIEMSNLWPHAVIHTFEPTEVYEQLVETSSAYPNIYTYNIALDSSSSNKKMYAATGKYTQLSSLHKPSEYFTKNPKFKFEEITVNTITLDEWAEQNNISQIDLLWLDAQGAELNILKGAIKILKNIRAIFVEVNTVERYENSVLYLQLKEWLLARDFVEIAKDEVILNNRFNVLFMKRAAFDNYIIARNSS